MKIFLFVLTISYSLTVAHMQTNAQAPNWLWAKSAEGSGIETGRSIATDAAGNVVAIGEFGTPSITFGTTVLTNAGILSTNSRDIFIVKYDSVGNMLWVKSAGGDGEDYGSSICTDANGNIFVTGNFSSDSITFGTFTLFNDTVWSMYVVKYDPSGNVLWAKTAKSLWTNDGQGISTDASGNVVVTGGFYEPWVIFGSDTLTSVGSQDFFVVKYDSSGNLLWAKSAGGNSYEFIKSVSVDASGNILVTGCFQSSSISFDTTTTLFNAGNLDIFIVKYDASGNVLWAKSSGGSDDESGTSVFTDSSNNILVTGYFESNSITIGSTTLNNYSYSALFLPTDMFVVKYDSGGNVLWAKSTGGVEDESGNGITCDQIGNIFVTGSFDSDSVSFGAHTLLNSGDHDIFVLKYNTSGNEDWATTGNGPGLDEGFAIATDADGHAIITGLFGIPTVSFGTSILNNTGNLDFFVAKLNRSSTTGFNEFSKNDFNIKAFPNPFSTQTTLQTETRLLNASVIVYNSVGQIVKRIDNFSGQTIIFRRDKLPSGLYFIQITQDNKAISAAKLIILDN